MQTFHSSSPSQTPSTHLDAAVLPAMSQSAAHDLGLRVPLLPDNYSTPGGYASDDVSASVTMPEISIVAANPENVLPGTPLSEVEAVGLDNVDIKFAHDQQPAEQQESGLLGDLWRGMVDDVFGPTKKMA